MTVDIEHLKTTKIAADADAEGEQSIERRKLPTLPGLAERTLAPPQGQHLEAFGGEGIPATEPVDVAVVRELVVAALRTVFDPEIPVNIYDLGLIYDIDVTEAGNAEVKMTLTAPACPVAGSLVQEVATKVGQVAGVSQSRVELVWEPAWTPDRMTEAAKLELGMF